MILAIVALVGVKLSTIAWPVAFPEKYSTFQVNPPELTLYIPAYPNLLDFPTGKMKSSPTEAKTF